MLYRALDELEAELNRLSPRVEREHDIVDYSEVTFRVYQPVDAGRLDALLSYCLAVDPQTRGDRGDHWEVHLVLRREERGRRALLPMEQTGTGLWVYEFQYLDEVPVLG